MGRLSTRPPQTCQKCLSKQVAASRIIYNCENCKKDCGSDFGFAPHVCYLCSVKLGVCGFCRETYQKPKKEPQFAVLMIERILQPKTKFLDKDFWPREIVFANRLFNKYPNKEFWLNAPFKQMKTFVYLLAGEAADLDKQYKRFIFNPIQKTEEIKIGEKVGADYNKESKARTLREFFN